MQNNLLVWGQTVDLSSLSDHTPESPDISNLTNEDEMRPLCTNATVIYLFAKVKWKNKQAYWQNVIVLKTIQKSTWESKAFTPNACCLINKATWSPSWQKQWEIQNERQINPTKSLILPAVGSDRRAKKDGPHPKSQTPLFPQCDPPEFPSTVTTQRLQWLYPTALLTLWI